MAAANDQPAKQADQTTEHILLDEPSTADLRSKVTDAWNEFARALADVLPTLPEGAYIELTLDRPPPASVTRSTP